MSDFPLQRVGSVRRRRSRAVPALVLAVALGLPAVAGAAALRSVLHRGETMPGTSLLGADVSGLPGAEAGLAARSLTAARLARPVPLAVAGRRLEIVPGSLFTLDRRATAAALLRSGRSSLAGRAQALLAPLTAPPAVEPVLVARPAAERRLRALLRPFARPAVAAAVSMRGVSPVATPARSGTRPDLGRLLDGLRRRIVSGTGAVAVPFEPARPAVSDAAAAEAAQIAATAVSAPVRVTLRGRPLAVLSPGRLARLLTFEPRGDRLLVLLERERLARVLDPALAPFKRRAVNARFAVDGNRARVVPGRAGVGLDDRDAVYSVLTAAHRAAGRVAPVRLAPVAPELTTAEARALGIRERVSSFTTDMGVSSSNRIHNVQLMADYIDGTIIRPGETFSFNRVVGPRTARRGFLEGQMIVGSLLLPSIGGGVCQTATTLFNNAFELGLPIVERHNHSFYISHYPLGRDATVSWGGPDLVFRNDLKSALLIKSSYTSSTLTFTFYGAPTGRRVVSATGPKLNWKPPKLAYALDPRAPYGSVRYVSGDEQPGFDVTVSRTVYAGSKVLRKDRFPSRYIPVGGTAVYGPGRTIPGSYFVIPET